MLLESPCMRTFIKCRFQLQCLFYQQKDSELKYLLNISLQTSSEEHNVYDMQCRSSERICEPRYLISLTGQQWDKDSQWRRLSPGARMAAAISPLSQGQMWTTPCAGCVHNLLHTLP